MTKRYILFILALWSLSVTHGQKLDEYYISISIDSTQGGRLKFLSDSTIELSSIPRHMSPSIKTVYKYTSKDSLIEIFPEVLTNRESQSTGLYMQYSALKTKMSLTKVDGGFIDYDKSLIYVKQKDFSDNPDIAYIIDGKTYIQDMGVTDGYGLIKKSPKTNKALQKRLKNIGKDNFTIEIVRGLNAYKRFGIDRVYGVILISTKNKLPLTLH
jgi:hypothetical protein